MRTIRRFYAFILHQPLTFVMGVVFMVLALLLANLSPFFVKWLTQAVQTNDLDQAFSLIVLLGGVLVISNLLENIGQLLNDKTMANTSALITHKVLTHIHNLDFAYHTNKSSGKLISLMKRGDEAFFSYYEVFNRSFLNIIVSFLVMLGAFAQLRWSYIFFVLILMSISFCISLYLVKLNVTKRKIFSIADDLVSSARVDNLVNFDTVKYFANEKFEQRRFAELLQNWTTTLLNYFFTFRYFDLILGNLINLALVGIMMMALIDLRLGRIGLADFLLVTTFSMTLFPKMMNFLFNLRELAKKYSDLQVYFELLDEPIIVLDPVQPTEITNPQGNVVFDHVTFAYDKTAEPVLNDFHLTIQGGESIALVGYSGAGKTTIAKLLMRMYDPQSGNVTLDGINLKQLTKETLRSKVGLVPQDPLLFNNTIYYNIAYAKNGATEAEVFAAAEASKVSDFVQKMHDGYQSIVGERGIKLSGGQRQRLAIARVLLKQPEIVVFDEATSALDSASEQSIQTAFWKMVANQGQPRTAIIIAHRLSTIMKADRIIVMDKGKIIEVGTHHELIENPDGIYHKLWSLQKDGFIGDGEMSQ